MIDIKELRVGNFVIVVDDIVEYDTFLEANNIYPITITKELLQSMGFKECYFTDGSEYLQIDETDYNKFGNPIHQNNELWKCYRLELFKNEWYFSIHKNPRSNMYFVKKKIYYIHELQNIYYALTNKELKLT